jgi:hypothetical protein
VRPDSPEVILLMLGRLKSLGRNPGRLPSDLLLGLLVDPGDLDGLESMFGEEGY